MSLPAAYDRFAREGQVQEASPDLEGQRVLQGVPVDDEGRVVLLAQKTPKVSAVLSNGCPRGLKQGRGGGADVSHFNKSKTEAFKKQKERPRNPKYVP